MPSGVQSLVLATKSVSQVPIRPAARADKVIPAKAVAVETSQAVGNREAVRGALEADDAVERQDGEPKFKVRDTPEWKKHAANLETEMLRRGMSFDIINWHEGQKALPFS